tara:strand:- start:13721 stop:14722 length:1002 start_codon:yes stop_codon:yes gene_type:complete
MTPSELIGKLGIEEPDSLYFLFGEERFYHEEIIRALKKKIITEENEEFNFEVFEAKSARVDEWLGAANTFSFLGGRKLVVVRDLHAALLDKNSSEPLLSYIERPAAKTCLVLTADKVDRKRKLDKTLTSLKTAVDCSAPVESVLLGWLQSRAQTCGFELSANAARMIVDLVGAKPGLLAVELEKIFTYAGEIKKIDETLASEVVGAFKLENVFELTNALKKKDHAEALRLLRRQLNHGEEPLKILGAIIWQFRFIWEVRYYVKNRLSAVQIANVMGSRPFIVKKVIPFSKMFSQKDLRAGFESLFHADKELKTSGMEPERIMEGLVLRLCSGG